MVEGGVGRKKIITRPLHTVKLISLGIIKNVSNELFDLLKGSFYLGMGRKRKVNGSKVK